MSVVQLLSALYLVPKKTGDWCPCGDYTTLNKITIPDKYPIPHIQDFIGVLQGATSFSRINLVKAYHQMSIVSVNIPKTVITIPPGLFEFLRMPFGLRNACQTFQLSIDDVVQGLEFCIVYTDRMVFSKRNKEHLAHLPQLFQCLELYGVDHFGIRPLPDCVTAIKNFPKPCPITKP